MSTNTSKSKAAALAQVQALIAGTQKHLASGSFTLGGTSFTAATFVPLLESVADAMTAVTGARSSVKDAMAAMEEAEAKVGPVIQAFKRFVLLTFSNATQTLADFAVTPPKARAVKSVEEKAAAKAKAAATRSARGTTSKKKKLAVKGNVTGVTVTPIIAPTAAPPAAPETAVSPSAQPVSTTSSAPILVGPVTK